MFRSTTRTQLIATLLAAGLAFTAASAQDAKPADPVLKGPSATDRNVPGVEGNFGGEEAGKRKYIQRIPPRVYQEAIRIILDDDAPAAIAATPDQREKIRDTAEFEKDMRAYMDEHRDELQKLRQEAGPMRPGELNRPAGKGGKAKGEQPKAPQPPDAQSGEQMTPEAENPNAAAARMRLREIMDGAPQAEQVFTKAWQELNPAQRDAVQAKLDEFKAQQEKQREAQYVKTKLGKKAKGAAEAGQPAAPGAPAANRPNADQPAAAGSPRLTPERRERLMRIFERLTPEQQDQLLQRLEERLRNEGGNGAPPPPPAAGKGRRPVRPGGGEDKPAPDPNNLKLPTPPPSDTMPEEAPKSPAPK